MSIGHPVTDEITGRITGLAPGVECDNEAGFHIDACYTLYDSAIKWAQFENLSKQCTRMRFNETLLHDSAKTQTRAIAKNTMLIPGTGYHLIDSETSVLSRSCVRGDYWYPIKAQGYLVLRFRANNPGAWPLHCHNLMHNLEGMAVFINITDEENNRPYSTVPGRDARTKIEESAWNKTILLSVVPMIMRYGFSPRDR